MLHLPHIPNPCRTRFKAPLLVLLQVGFLCKVRGLDSRNWALLRGNRVHVCVITSSQQRGCITGPESLTQPKRNCRIARSATSCVVEYFRHSSHATMRNECWGALAHALSSLTAAILHGFASRQRDDEAKAQQAKVVHAASSRNQQLLVVAVRSYAHSSGPTK